MLHTIDNIMKNERYMISDYAKNFLQNLQLQLDSSFGRFLDEQIKAIADVKLTTKKRSGLLHFIKIFPVRNCLVSCYTLYNTCKAFRGQSREISRRNNRRISYEASCE
jgi:hypothetical protein